MSQQNNYDSKMKRIEQIIESIEQGKIPLVEVEEKYKEAVSLAQSAKEDLINLKNKIEVLNIDFNSNNSND